MNTPVKPCPVPAQGEIRRWLPKAHFHDAYCVAVQHPERTAMAHLQAALQATPPWVDNLMGLRNRLAALCGLKHLGSLGHRAPASSALEPGDHVGIFTLIQHNDDEVLVGDADKHLRVVISVRRMPAQGAQPAQVVMTTVVHIHNLLGHLYMLPVKPLHKLIAPAVMARINDGAAAAPGVHSHQPS